MTPFPPTPAAEGACRPAGPALILGLILFGVLTYAVVVFRVPFPFVQVLGPPLLALGMMALLECRRAPRRGGVRASVAAALPVGLLLGIGADGYLLVRIAGRAAPAVAVREDPAQWAEVRPLLEKQDWRGIVGWYERHPDAADWGVLGAAASAYDAVGDAARAEDLYRRAIQMNPSAKSPRLRLARFLETAGRGREAAAEYERLLNLYGDDPDVHFGYGVLLLDLNRPDLAAPHLERAAALYPEGRPGKSKAKELLDRIPESAKKRKDR